MQELVLRHYFTGQCTLDDLKRDLTGAVVEHRLYEQHPIAAMDSDFTVTPRHLVSLCDEVLAGRMAPGDLEPIGVCLEASEHFNWDENSEAGKRVTVTVYEWAAPEDARPLTVENVTRYRERLVNGGDPFRQ